MKLLQLSFIPLKKKKYKTANMSKKATSTKTSKIFNINKEARKFYPRENTIFDPAPVPCYSFVTGYDKVILKQLEQQVTFYNNH